MLKSNNPFAKIAIFAVLLTTSNASFAGSINDHSKTKPSHQSGGSSARPLINNQLFIYTGEFSSDFKFRKKQRKFNIKSKSQQK